MTRVSGDLWSHSRRWEALPARRFIASTPPRRKWQWQPPLTVITNELDWLDRAGCDLLQRWIDQPEPDLAQLTFLLDRSRAIVAQLNCEPDPDPARTAVLADARHVTELITWVVLQIRAGTVIEPDVPAC